MAGRFDAIAVGASAGGVIALQRLLSRLPADFPVPILVVLHLPRDRPSRVADLLDLRCSLHVREAEDKQPLLAGTVTVAPPDYHLLVEDPATLALSCDPPVQFSRPAIDPLFESAADVFGERLLAILLTGASSDGSAGVAAARRVGATAWIQCPEDAASPLMPAAAIVHAGADAILTLQQICDQLERFRQ